MNLRNHYDSMYLLPSSVPWRTKKHNRQLASLLCNKKIKTPMRVLDLGCGAGKNTKYLESKGFEVFGIDFSLQALKLARQERVKSPLALAEASVLPFKKNTFDLVVDFGCFHCLPPASRNKTRNEILRVLKPKGLYFARLWYSDQAMPKVLLPIFFANNHVPIWGFSFDLSKRIFQKGFKLEYVNKEMDEDNYGPFLLLLMSKK